MIKSSGEFLTVSLLEKKGYNPLVYRFFCLQSHYRKPLEFSYDVLDNVAVAYDKLHKKVLELKEDGAVDNEKFATYRAKFEEVLSNDMNTSMAITMIYDVLRDDMNDATKKALIASFDEVLSLDLTVAEEVEEVEAELEAFIVAKIAERKEAKKAKDFAKADAIRAELLEKGVQIKDTREGTVWSVL